uniref:Transcriptional regulator n=1 Tax=Ascaris lumbricoides TaxID=6252 RepID=A0A0M3I3V7_ASCLU
MIRRSRHNLYCAHLIAIILYCNNARCNITIATIIKYRGIVHSNFNRLLACFLNEEVRLL